MNIDDFEFKQLTDIFDRELCEAYSILKYIGSDEDVTVPDSFQGMPVTRIEEKAFENCSLVSVHFPKSLSNIEADAFANCNSLQKITAERCYLFIHKRAFRNCDALYDIPFDMWGRIYLSPQQLINIMKDLSLVWSHIDTSEQKDYIDFFRRRKVWQRHLFTKSEPELMHFFLGQVISPGLGDINGYLESSIRENNTIVTALLLDYKNNNFKQKDIEALAMKMELTEMGLEYPAVAWLRKKWLVRDRGEYFSIAGYLGDNETESIPERCKNGKPILRLEHSRVGYGSLKRLILPVGIESIGEKAFYESQIQEIDIPSTVRKIEKGAFMHCSSLSTVNFSGNGLISIESGAFAHCYKLKNIQIPNSVTTIGRDTFHICNSLESLKLPASLIELGPHVFSQCDQLKIVIFESITTDISPQSFYKCYSLVFVGYENGENLLL